MIFLVGRAEYIDDPLNYAWDFVMVSHSAKDSVLYSSKRQLEHGMAILTRNTQWKTVDRHS